MSIEQAVLLVDDSPDTLEMYAMGLSFAGYRPLTAADADSALVQLELEHPIAVVTDLKLLGTRDGWELIRDIKNNPATRPLPVLVLTGRTEPSITAHAERSGCAAVLTKPCLPDELARVLEQLVPAI